MALVRELTEENDLLIRDNERLQDRQGQSPFHCTHICTHMYPNTHHVTYSIIQNANTSEGRNAINARLGCLPAVSRVCSPTK